MPVATDEPAAKIAFRCSCGVRLMAKPKYAGKAIRCPKCSSMATVPGAAAEAPAAPVPPVEPPAMELADDEGGEDGKPITGDSRWRTAPGHRSEGVDDAATANQRNAALVEDTPVPTLRRRNWFTRTALLVFLVLELMAGLAMILSGLALPLCVLLVFFAFVAHELATLALAIEHNTRHGAEVAAAALKYAATVEHRRRLANVGLELDAECRHRELLEALRARM
jgi:hypothetical protein